MSMVAKILIVVNLILAVLVMGAAGGYVQSAENYKKRYEDNNELLTGQIKEQKEQNAKLQGALDDASRGKATAESKMAALEAQCRTYADNQVILAKKLDDQVANIASMTANAKDMQANYEAARKDIEKLQGEKAQADTEKRAAQDAKTAAETEQKRLTDELANRTASLDAKEKAAVAMADEIEKLNTHLDMYKAKVGPIGLVEAPVKGVVLGADTGTDIYLISVGTKDGLKLAQELTVYRNDKFVAQVVVDKVFDDKASVTVKRVNGKPFKAMDIKQGDKVATVY